MHALREQTDAGVIERLYREHGGRLWRAVLAYSGSRQIADDAVSEAFAQALASTATVRDPMAWVWRVAFRTATRELRDRRRHTDAGPDLGYEHPDGVDDLLTALRTLSPNQRGAIVLHHYIGYPVREVASILGSTPASVRVHLSVGRTRLRALLEETDDA